MKIRKELWFGYILIAMILIPIAVLMPWGHMTNGHYGLLMLALIVVGIMMGFPTAFTLMGMGVFFGWLAYRSVNPALAERQILDLMVQRAYYVMSNDVLIAVPLFVFMGYLIERAALIDKLFRALHLAMARVPGSLAVATIVTCAIFATATGIIGAVVTLMGLLAFPAMLKAGYNVKVGAGVITAGGTLGILIPPSVLLILYGATAGVSVVQLYAGAFFPRHHARRAVCRLRHRAGEVEAFADAAASRERAARGNCPPWRSRWPSAAGMRWSGCRVRSPPMAASPKRTALGQLIRHAAAAAVHRRGARRHLFAGDHARGRRYDRVGRGRRRRRFRREGGIEPAHRPGGARMG